MYASLSLIITIPEFHWTVIISNAYPAYFTQISSATGAFKSIIHTMFLFVLIKSQEKEEAEVLVV